MVRLPRNEKQTYQLKFRPQIGPFGFDLGHDIYFQLYSRPEGYRNENYGLIRTVLPCLYYFPETYEMRYFWITRIVKKTQNKPSDVLF